MGYDFFPRRFVTLTRHRGLSQRLGGAPSGDRRAGSVRSVLRVGVRLGIGDGFDDGALLLPHAPAVQEQRHDGAEDGSGGAEGDHEEAEDGPGIEFRITGDCVRRHGCRRESQQGAEDQERHEFGGPADGDLATLSGRFVQRHAIQPNAGHMDDITGSPHAGGRPRLRVAFTIAEGVDPLATT